MITSKLPVGIALYGKRPVVWSVFDGELTLEAEAAELIRKKYFSAFDKKSIRIVLLIDGKPYKGRLMNVISSNSVQIAYGNEVKSYLKKV